MKSSITFVICAILLTIGCVASTQAQLAKIENEIPDSVPLKIEFQNEKSEDWAHDLEIQVTNTGSKPIYFLYLILSLERKKTDGTPRYGFALTFGSPRLYSSSKLPQPEDLSISPQATRVMKIGAETADAWARLIREGRRKNRLSGFIGMGWLYYGDGTGFSGHGVPFTGASQ